MRIPDTRVYCDPARCRPVVRQRRGHNHPMHGYDRTGCPYCGAGFNPLPRGRKRCPSCGQVVWVRLGPDGRRYLLREADLAEHEARWKAHHERTAEEEAARRNLEAARLSRKALRSYADGGLRHVEITSASDPCPACAVVIGRRFALSTAPPIPVPGCSNAICRCDYVPLIS